MKEYRVCNKCGRKLHYKHGVLKEDALMIKKDWGYFSQKDLQIHSFALCEECYDRWIETFAVPVKRIEKKMVLE